MNRITLLKYRILAALCLLALCGTQSRAAENAAEPALYVGGAVISTVLGFTTAGMLGYDTPINLPDFLSQNETQILQDGAQGGGEYLSGMFDLMALLPAEKAEASRVVQERFDDWADAPAERLPEILEDSIAEIRKDG